jgi:hypothetical protein
MSNPCVLIDEITNLEAALREEHKVKCQAARDAYAEAEKELADGLLHIEWLRSRLPHNGEPQAKRKRIVPTYRQPGDGSESLSAGIRLAVKSLGQFTADDVAEWVKKHSPAVGKGDRRDAITIALSRLRKHGILEVVTPGLRGKPQVYKTVGSNGEDSK